jgi:NADH-quinone oxidoreductase subunit N
MISYGMIYALSPTLIVIGALSLLGLSFSKNLSSKHYSFISVGFLFIALVIQLILFNTLSSSGYLFETIFNKMFVIDKFSILFDILFLSGAMFTLLINTYYFKNRDYYDGEFFALLLLSVFGMMMLSHANELITAFVALEIASITVYILVGYNKYNVKSSEAMLKYIVLGALTGAFFILGSALVYGSVGSTHLGEIYNYIDHNQGKDMTLLIVGLFFILVTILFKIGAVPFHSWVVDVYHGAPFPVTMFMAATFKIAIFAILLRLYLVDFAPFYDIFSIILQLLAVFTLIGGSFLAISQTNLKRMLAGSSIVHGGYLLIALSSIGLGASFAAPAIVFYLISYFLSAVGAFGILSFLASDQKKRLTFEHFKGFAYERPYMAAMMSIFMLSLAGFPSTIGFLGKFYIFLTAIESGQLFLAALGITIAFISIYYYFKLIALMYFYRSNSSKEKFPIAITSGVIVLLAVLTIWGGIGTGLLSFIPGADGLIQVAHDSIEQIAK